MINSKKIYSALILLLIYTPAFPMHTARKVFSRFCTGYQWIMLSVTPLTILAGRYSSYFGNHYLDHLADANPATQEYVRKQLVQQGEENPENIAIKKSMVEQDLAFAIATMQKSYIVLNMNQDLIPFKKIENKSADSTDLAICNATLAHEYRHIANKDFIQYGLFAAASPFLTQAGCTLVALPFKHAYTKFFKSINPHSFTRSLLKIPGTSVTTTA